MIRIAAVGDVHVDRDVLGRYRPALEQLPGQADVLLLAGDLTRHGTAAEAACVASEFGGLGVPVIAVLGNHDHHSDEVPRVVEVLERGGVTVLEGTSTVVRIGDRRLGVAGAKGFGGGYAGRCASAFGEPEMKAFVGTTSAIADRLGACLRDLDCDVRVALTHYSPVPDTLVGEPPEIYPFLGSYLLAQAIDSAPTALALHGHAHAGTERGRTPGGVRVRNVAHPVIKQAYNVYHLMNDGSATDGRRMGLPRNPGRPSRPGASSAPSVIVRFLQSTPRVSAGHGTSSLDSGSRSRRRRCPGALPPAAAVGHRPHRRRPAGGPRRRQHLHLIRYAIYRRLVCPARSDSSRSQPPPGPPSAVFVLPDG